MKFGLFIFKYVSPAIQWLWKQCGGKAHDLIWVEIYVGIVLEISVY